MSWYTGASDALEQALVERERLRRQAMLDAIAAEDRKAKDEDRKVGRRIQESQLESVDAQRKEAIQRMQQQRAAQIASTLRINQDIDGATEQSLREGDLGGLVERHDAVNAPVMLPGGGMTQVGVPVPERRSFTGTAAQHEQVRAAAALAAHQEAQRKQAEQTARENREAANERNRSDNERALETARIAGAGRGDAAAGREQNSANRRIDAYVARFNSNPLTKRHTVQQEALSYVESLDPNSTSSADDQSLIYAFAKANDPDSVVREGEYATVQKYAQSYAEKFGFDVKRMAVNSEFLTPQARANMVKVIRGRAAATGREYAQLYKTTHDNLVRIAGPEAADYLPPAPRVTPKAGNGTPSGSGIKSITEIK